jgi:hypothetical protein
MSSAITRRGRGAGQPPSGLYRRSPRTVGDEVSGTGTGVVVGTSFGSGGPASSHRGPTAPPCGCVFVTTV